MSDEPADSFDVESPRTDLDTLVKTAYDSVPFDVPFRRQLSTAYHAVVGSRTGGGGTAGSVENDIPHPVRRLDPINRWRAMRYLDRRFDTELERRRSLGQHIREILEECSFGVQPDTSGRAYHALSVTVPGDRDALLPFLESRGHAVRTVWKNPLGLMYGSEADYPVTAKLAEESLMFAIAEMTNDDVCRLELDLQEFSGR